MKNLKILFVEDKMGPLKEAVQAALNWGADPREIVGVLVQRGLTDKLTTDEMCRYVREDLLQSVWRVVEPRNVMEVGREIGEIFRHTRCHIGVIDLQLDGVILPQVRRGDDDDSTERVPLTLQQGVSISRILHSDYGAYYLIWRTQHADNILQNPVNQVRLPEYTALLVLQCPRTFVVPLESDAFISALQTIYDEIFRRLPQTNLEWRVPAYRLARLRNRMRRRGNVTHTFQLATDDDFNEYARFELIPRYDPPCPFGLWLQSQGRQELEQARGADYSRRGELGYGLEDWLDKHLWGLPFHEIGELLEQTAAEWGLNAKDFQVDKTALDTETGSLVPCAREALVMAVGNALKNAKENKPNGTQVQIKSEIVRDYGTPYWLLIVANLIESATTLLNRIGEIQPRGMVYINDAIRDLNGFEHGDTWGFQFHIWQNGGCLSDSICVGEPWQCGAVGGHPEFTNGSLRILSSMTTNGDWATAIFMGPVKQQSILNNGATNESNHC